MHMPAQAHRHIATSQQGSASDSTPVMATNQQRPQSNQAMQERLSQRQNAAGFARAVNATAFENIGLRAAVFTKAMISFEKAYQEGRSNSPVVTIIDYELPSKQKRLWVIDLQEKKLLFHEYTTHGQGSDRNHDGQMDSASNTNNSHQSNVGLMVTDETYTGRHGKSLRMDGLEPGFNDNARDRSIVFHSAGYADDEYIERNGKAGRSHGCPALDPDVSGQIIDTIKGGKMVFAYYPDENWLQRSTYLNP
jgi:hypothetical protein